MCICDCILFLHDSKNISLWHNSLNIKSKNFSIAQKTICVHEKNDIAQKVIWYRQKQVDV